MKRRHRLCLPGLMLTTALCAAAIPARADSTYSDSTYSDSLYGPLGLNVVPNARMDAPGTIKAGISTADPYLHGYIGVQLAAPLYVQLRQSAQTSSLLHDPDAFYPGLDVKLRLLRESTYYPEIAVGFQSALGERRMGGEYLALSKRVHDFDLTAGLGWGRLGSAGHFGNPFSFLGGRYDKRRALDGADSHEPKDWFSGDSIGVFAGVEYFTPVDGLSLKFDIGADRYTAERAAFGFDSPAPWSVGVSYSPAAWLNIGAATQGTDTVMGRITFRGPAPALPGLRKDKPQTVPLQAKRTEHAEPGAMATSAAQDGILLTHTAQNQTTASANLRIEQGYSLPHMIGRAAVHMANNAGPEIEEIALTPTYMGLAGPKISLLRKDLERALTHHQASPEEMWRNATFTPQTDWRWQKRGRFEEVQTGDFELGLTLENSFSLAEEDSGLLGRSALILEARSPQFFGFVDSGVGIRYNFADNLDRLSKFRPPVLLPVRSNVDIFAQRSIALDKLYATFSQSLRSDFHAALTAGYLEEMYAGLGGEVLYRPFDARYAIGAEAWQVFKRDPYSSLNMALNGDHVLTAHVNAWYDLPVWDMTLKGQFGRYLAEDVGGTLGLQKTFTNGARIEVFTTLTDQRDIDIFGEKTHAYHGLKMVLPLGGLEYVPDNTKMVVNAVPLGRDTGQSLNKPFDLYEATENFSYAHISRHWSEILPKSDEAQKKMTAF